MNHLQLGSFYLLRRPLLPIEPLIMLLQESDTCLQRTKLRLILAETTMQEALYLASPSLYKQCQQWLDNPTDPDNPTDKDTPKLVLALLKYVIRASSRSTPFGMFAGITSPGSFDNNNSFDHNSAYQTHSGYQTHSRLDMAWMEELIYQINQQTDIRNLLRFYPNSSLYHFENSYRYTYKNRSSKQFSICSVETSVYLERIIQSAQCGASLLALASSLVSDQITIEEAHSFLHQLVEEQILVSELQLSVHGTEPLQVLYQQLSSMLLYSHLTDETYRHIQTWQDRVRKITHLLNDKQSQIQKGTQIQYLLSDLDKTMLSECPIQTDIVFATYQNTLRTSFSEKLTFLLSKLVCINQGIYLADLEYFKSKFKERYQSREVELLKVLDSELGIGYSRINNSEKGYLPLLECLHGSEQSKKPAIEWNFWKEFLMDKYSDALLHGSLEIELTERDIVYLQENTNATSKSLPTHGIVFGNLLAGPEESLDEDNFLFCLSTMSGPCPGNLFTRFCHTNPDLYTQVQQIIEAEEAADPDVIYAEIVHLPDPKAGNILIRPVLRHYQIPYLHPAHTLDTTDQNAATDVANIPLNDLLISIGESGKVVLRSRTLNKQVIPRLTSAHDFSGGLEIYRFLCDLQYEHSVLNVAWHWSILEKRKYLPRVRYQNIILSRAMWNLRLRDYPSLKQKNPDTSVFFQSIRTELNIPRYVCVTKTDNEILLDLENCLCQQIFLEEIVKYEQVQLKEFLQLPDQCLLKDQNGKYTNEIIFPFCLTPTGSQHRKAPINNKSTIHTRQSLIQLHTTSSFSNKNLSSETANLLYRKQLLKENVSCTSMKNTITPFIHQRCFSIGSEWFYFKIYTGEKTADQLLKTLCKDLFEHCLESGLIDSYFFVRYTDPEFHLRIRLHCPQPKQSWHKLISLVQDIFEPYLHKELIHKLQIDTYEREIERYGSATLPASEELFFHDSRAVLSWLQTINSDNQEKSRWLFALCGVDFLLTDFHYSLEEKITLMRQLSSFFETEQELSPQQRKDLNLQYRDQLHTINEVIHRDTLLKEGKQILRQRSLSSQGAITQIMNQVYQSHPAPDTECQRLISSYLHMFFNRLFISNPRQHELVIYSFLLRNYLSQAALLKKNKLHSTVLNQSVSS